MNSELFIFTREGCGYCHKLKIILDSFDVKYTQFKLDVDFERYEFYGQFGEGATFPQVILDGQRMGGCTETIEYLTSIGCLQEEKDMECVI